jgi:fucose 4-O-acetylase-like acetyltransferase
MDQKKRVEWIDIAKGLGITLVSFGHLSNGDGQAVCTSCK